MYAQAFEGLPNKTLYSPGARGIGGKSTSILYEKDFEAFGAKSMRHGDLRVGNNSLYESFGAKAQLTTAGGAGTAGYAMIPVYVDPMIIDQTRKYTPLVELIPRVTNRGIYADYNKITAKGGASTGAENGDLVESDTTYDRASTAIKYLYAVGGVTGQTNVAQPAYTIQGFAPGQTGASMNAPFMNQAAANAKQQKLQRS